MLEIKCDNAAIGPKIVVIGVGGGGNNALNEAISYVRELAGEKVNIIWGTVTKEIQRPFEKELVLKDYKPVAPRKEVELIMPTFLQEAAAKKGRR